MAAVVRDQLSGSRADGKDPDQAAGAVFIPRPAGWLEASSEVCVSVLVGARGTDPQPPEPGQRGSTTTKQPWPCPLKKYWHEGGLLARDAPLTGILIHQPSGGYEGQSTDVEIHAREILELRARVDQIYARHTGQSVERVHADMERDRYFSGEEAVAYGLVDRLIDHRQVTNGARGFGQG